MSYNFKNRYKKNQMLLKPVVYVYRFGRMIFKTYALGTSKYVTNYTQKYDKFDIWSIFYAMQMTSLTMF